MSDTENVSADVGTQLLGRLGQTVGSISGHGDGTFDVHFYVRPPIAALAQADALIIAARNLGCHYTSKGDSCDDHQRRKTPDFTACGPCMVRRMAERTKTEKERLRG